MLWHSKINLQCTEPRLVNLYNNSFPANERRALTPILRDSTGSSELLAFYDDSTFCGFSASLINGDILHIIYFAVEKLLRGKGYGHAILRENELLHPGYRIIVDIESLVPDSPNLDERIRRKHFYESCGYETTDVIYDWRGESYTILSKNGSVSSDEFNGFWKNIGKINGRLMRY